MISILEEDLTSSCALMKMEPPKCGTSLNTNQSSQPTQGSKVVALAVALLRMINLLLLGGEMASFVPMIQHQGEFFGKLQMLIEDL